MQVRLRGIGGQGEGENRERNTIERVCERERCTARGVLAFTNAQNTPLKQMRLL